MDWYSVKLVALEATNLSRDALHVLLGFGGQVAAAVVLRRSLASPLPWLAVLTAELANEWFDLDHETWPNKPMWPGSVHDVWVTMLIPTVLLLLARYAPGIISPAPAPPARKDAGEASEEATG